MMLIISSDRHKLDVLPLGSYQITSVRHTFGPPYSYQATATSHHLCNCSWSDFSASLIYALPFDQFYDFPF